MNVADLIAILKTLDPEATVVVPTYDDRADVHNARGLQLGGVNAVKLRPIVYRATKWFTPDRGVDLFEIDDEGELSGVEIG